jgi:hypothetical protein
LYCRKKTDIPQAKGPTFSLGDDDDNDFDDDGDDDTSLHSHRPEVNVHGVVEGDSSNELEDTVPVMQASTPAPSLAIAAPVKKMAVSGGKTEVGQSGQTGQAGHTGQTGQTGQSGQTGQTEQTGQTGQTGQSGQTGQTGQTAEGVAKAALGLFNVCLCGCHILYKCVCVHVY